jgi:hypothetical protein
MIGRRLTCILTAAAVALLMVGCETKKPDTNDTSHPTVEILFKQPDQGAQYVASNSANMGNNGLTVLGRAKDPESGI